MSLPSNGAEDAPLLADDKDSINEVTIAPSPTVGIGQQARPRVSRRTQPRPLTRTQPWQVGNYKLPQWLPAVVFGQAVSFCLCGTSVTSQVRPNKHVKCIEGLLATCHPLRNQCADFPIISSVFAQYVIIMRISMLSIILVGLVFCVSLYRQGRLWQVLKARGPWCVKA